jgi:hypothetical protein
MIDVGVFHSAYADWWPSSCMQDDSSEEMTEAREPQIGEHSYLLEPPSINVVHVGYLWCCSSAHL